MGLGLSTTHVKKIAESERTCHASNMSSTEATFYEVQLTEIDKYYCSTDSHPPDSSYGGGAL